ncbi:MAG: hypothetical protein HN356_12905, partial [Calditrichaeota bacterium]|nr:hypothetical protein [Calditrichota bacterium]
MPDSIRTILEGIGIWAIPFILVLIILFGMFKKVKVYEVFVEGAKEGFDVGVRIIPYLVAILAAIAIFRASGALDILSSA